MKLANEQRFLKCVIFLSLKKYKKGDISYVFNPTKNLWSSEKLNAIL